MFIISCEPPNERDETQEEGQSQRQLLPLSTRVS